MNNKRKIQRTRYLDEINFNHNDIEPILQDKVFIADNTRTSNNFIDNQTKTKTLQLHNAVQKAVEDKQKYAKYNIATVDYDDKGEKYNMNLPTVKITAKTPDYLNYVDEYDIARANQYYGNDLNKKTRFLKDIGTYNKTGQSQFMQDINRLAVLPNLAMIGAGLGSGAIFNPAFSNLASASFVANELSDKNYKNAAIEAALGFGPLGIVKGAQMIGKTNLARSAVMSAMLRNGIKNATKYGSIDVNPKYFTSPDEWYRFVDRPEIGTIEELGMNVTSTDGLRIPSMSNNFRVNAINNANRGSNKFIVRKLGSAHGNMSQASAKQLWSGTIAGNNDLFKHGVLTGRLPKEVYKGRTRSNYYKTDVDNINLGDRIGFPTGEMPIENLKYFEQLPNKKFRYMGEVLPNKIEYVIGNSNPFYLNYKQPVNNILYSTSNTPIISNNIRQLQLGAPIDADVLNDFKHMTFPRYAELMTGKPYTVLDDATIKRYETRFNNAIKDTKKNVLDDSNFSLTSTGHYDKNTNTINLPQTNKDSPLYPNTTEYHELLHALYNNDKFLASIMRGKLGFEGKLGRVFTSKYKNNNGTVNTLLSKEELANTLSETKREVLKHPERYITNSELLKKYKANPSDITIQNEILDNVEDYKFLNLFSDINGYGDDFIEDIMLKVNNNLIDRYKVNKYFSNLKAAYKILPAGAGAVMINNK